MLTQALNSIDISKESISTLPIVHNCSGYVFDKIKMSADPHLAPSHCKEFRESLLYYFYGIPGYRMGPSVIPDSKFSHYPVAIIHDFPDEKFIKRVFPFDSGAFIGARYASVIPASNDPLVEVEKYLIKSNLVSNYIYAFYNNNKSYFNGKVNPLGSISSNVMFEPLLSLLKARNDSKFDDRCSCVELQVCEKMFLSSVRAIILPDCYGDRDDEINKIRNICPKPATIDLYCARHDTADYHVITLTQAVYSYLLKEGSL